MSVFLFLLCSYLPTQSWEWDPNPVEDQVTHYRIYYSSASDVWCEVQVIDLPVADVCREVCTPPPVEVCWYDWCQYEPGPLPGDIYYNVTAVNVVDESEWDHGTKKEVCP